MEAPPEETAPKRARARLRAASSGALVVSRGEDARCGEGRADALERAGRDELARRLGEPAERGGDGEDGETDLEGAAAAEDVAEAPPEEQEPAEGERVGVEDPREGRGAEGEVGVDARERDVHDRGVEHDHQLGDQDDRDAGGGAAGLRRQLGRELVPGSLREQGGGG